MEDKEYVINPQGTTAVISTDEREWNNSSYYDVLVYLTFSDPALNPPGEQRWFAGEFTPERHDNKEEIIQDIGNSFYSFLMNFRTAYDQEDAVNEQRRKYELEQEIGQAKQRQIQTLEDQIRINEARIQELETDRVKFLEGKVKNNHKNLTALRSIVAELMEFVDVGIRDTSDV